MMRHGTYKIQVIDRALAMLDLLATDGPALTLAELARRSKLPKSTSLRLLNVLQRHRFVDRDPRTGGYRLGLKLHELGSQAVAQFDFVERARPHLRRLMAASGESVFLAVLDGAEVLALERVESSHTVRVPLNSGGRTPAHCTANGKALIAFIPEHELLERLGKRTFHAYTRNTITKFAQLKTELRTVRDNGYAVDREEMEDGLKCIGAPVRNHSGAVVASVAILGPAFRLPEAKVRVTAALVVRAADELSHELGFREPEAHSVRNRAKIGAVA